MAFIDIYRCISFWNHWSVYLVSNIFKTFVQTFWNHKIILYFFTFNIFFIFHIKNVILKSRFPVWPRVSLNACDVQWSLIVCPSWLLTPDILILVLHPKHLLYQHNVICSYECWNDCMLWNSPGTLSGHMFALLQSLSNFTCVFCHVERCLWWTLPAISRTLIRSESLI